MADSSDLAGEPRQGDHLPHVASIVLLGMDDGVERVETPLGVVVLTQCCDLARGGRGFAHVAKVVELSGATASAARSGRAGYVPLPELGEAMFGDLSTVGGMAHAAVSAQERQPSVRSEERHLFGERVGRRFSRFAYPDAAQPLINWIVGEIRKKASASNSPLSGLWERVDRVRLESSGDWEQTPLDLTLLVIVRTGELPTLDASRADVSKDREQPGIATLSAVGEAISTATPGTTQAGELWREFEGIFAQRAMEGAKLAPEILGSLVVEVLEEGELSYEQFRRSANLDVDHVSGPLLDD